MKEQRAQAALDLEAKVQGDSHLMASVRTRIKKSVLHPTLFTSASTGGKPPPVEVLCMGAVEAVQKICTENRYQHVAVLNFASGTRPGGGWRSGARAQEEDLCLGSTLGLILEGRPDFYTQEKGLYTHNVLFTPFVRFFGPPLHSASVLTCAAPNMNSIPSDQKELAEMTFDYRIGHVLNVAEHYSVTHLILGAWGCGVFKNDPKFVAACFAKHLQGRKFESVTFAILGPEGEQHEIFRQALGLG